MKLLKAIFNLFKDSLVEFFKDRAAIFAAGLAYYTIFAIAPLLVLVTGLAGLFIGRSAANEQIALQLQYLVGSDLAGFLGEITTTLSSRTANRTAALLSAVGLLIAAGGIFNQLKTALNLIWGITNVSPKNRQEWLLLARYRAIPFLMVFIFGFLMILAYIVEGIVGVISARFEVLFPDVSAIVPQFSFFLIPALTFVTFSLVFRFMPDAYVRWREVAVGALVTTALFLVGRRLLAYFLSLTDTGSIYGAAGSIVIMLIWIYFSAQILLIGAEFTWLFALRYGRPIRPKRLAAFIELHDDRPDSAPK
jgi:membrane protein